MNLAKNTKEGLIQHIGVLNGKHKAELKSKNSQIRICELECDNRILRLKERYRKLIEAKNTELKTKDDEIKARDDVIKDKKAKLRAKSDELRVKNLELKAKNDEIKLLRNEPSNMMQEDDEDGMSVSSTTTSSSSTSLSRVDTRDEQKIEFNREVRKPTILITERKRKASDPDEISSQQASSSKKRSVRELSKTGRQNLLKRGIKTHVINEDGHSPSAVHRWFKSITDKVFKDSVNDSITIDQKYIVVKCNHALKVINFTGTTGNQQHQQRLLLDSTGELNLAVVEDGWTIRNTNCFVASSATQPSCFTKLKSPFTTDHGQAMNCFKLVLKPYRLFCDISSVAVFVFIRV